jgi:hypothetical protein
MNFSSTTQQLTYNILGMLLRAAKQVLKLVVGSLVRVVEICRVSRVGPRE